MIEIIYFTLAGVILYLVSDVLLNQIEIMRGQDFKRRNFIFVTLILTLAILVFTVLELILQR